MGYRNERADSDSVNLGSNPSPPATANADVSGISRAQSASEKSEIPEQTAHTGRTETGTAPDDDPELGWWEGDLDDDCDHDDYDRDILTGIATCNRCGHRWSQTKEEVEAESRRQQEYDKQCEEWDREPARSPAPPFAGSPG